MNLHNGMFIGAHLIVPQCSVAPAVLCSAQQILAAKLLGVMANIFNKTQSLKHCNEHADERVDWNFLAAQHPLISKKRFSVVAHRLLIERPNGEIAFWPTLFDH
jgi:hypothetical protein